MTVSPAFKTTRLRSCQSIPIITHKVLLPINANTYQGYILNAASVAAISKQPVRSRTKG